MVFAKKHWDFGQNIEKQELCVKGWNYGETEFNGELLLDLLASDLSPDVKFTTTIPREKCLFSGGERVR